MIAVDCFPVHHAIGIAHYRDAEVGIERGGYGVAEIVGIIGSAWREDGGVGAGMHGHDDEAVAINSLKVVNGPAGARTVTALVTGKILHQHFLQYHIGIYRTSCIIFLIGSVDFIAGCCGDDQGEQYCRECFVHENRIEIQR